MTLLIFISITIVSAFMGFIEGYGDTPNEKKYNLPVNEHIIYTVFRFIVGLSICSGFLISGIQLDYCASYIMDDKSEFIWMFLREATYCLLMSIFIFPFFHDGIYYETKRRLIGDKNLPDFFDESENTDKTNAKISVRFIVRLISYIIGIIMMLSEILNIVQFQIK